MRPRIRALLAVLAPLALLTAVAPEAGAVTDPATVTLTWTARGPAFTQPVAVTSARDGSGRLFVVEQTGTIKRFMPGGSTASTYLDIHTAVNSAGERGLLGLAFSPNFKNDRYFWVSYTPADGRLRVRRFTASASTPNTVSTSTGVTVLDVPHPDNSNHNAGQLAFGRDGLLYIGTGDGGGAGDAPNNALNVRSLSGKILRIDAKHWCGSLKYCIPSSNPFATSTTARRQIWAYGLRNPWKFSVDRGNGMLYIADVGQGAQEEVDRVAYGHAGGMNFGWSCKEGTLTYNAARCSGLGALWGPSIAYNHKSGFDCGGAVIGGYVYRGSTYSPFLNGLYIYGDYCYGRVFLWNGTKSNTVSTGPAGLSGFGESDTGEIWAVSVTGSQLFQMSAAHS
jgi:glucose/arabinose dehydrogenase